MYMHISASGLGAKLGLSVGCIDNIVRTRLLDEWRLQVRERDTYVRGSGRRAHLHILGTHDPYHRMSDGSPLSGPPADLTTAIGGHAHPICDPHTPQARGNTVMDRLVLLIAPWPLAAGEA